LIIYSGLPGRGGKFLGNVKNDKLMKTALKLLTIVLGIFLMISCQDKIEETYKINSPVYMSYDQLRTSLKVADGEDIIQPGKIYFKDNYIFVNEYQKGIHVIDNTDPANPSVEKFIEIPGNVDMAIKGSMLYADSYVDLITIDISDMENMVEVNRDTNVFPYVLPVEYPDGPIETIDESKGVVVGYNLIEKTEKIETNTQYYEYYPSYSWNERAMTDGMIASVPNGGVTNSGFGIGGSMARFTVFENSLYVIHNSNIKVFNIEDNSDPLYSNLVSIGWGIETLFPYKDKLFIGSQSGMFIYSLSNPLIPEYISEFSHMTACDPVVVEDNYAYVTLRGGNLCGAIASQLDVIDISNIQKPQLVKTYSMEEPYGLGIDRNTLFICDGNAGLKIYNASDPYAITQNLLVAYPNINAFDVIPLGDVLVMIGSDGLYQYNYTSLDNIQQISFIPIYAESEAE
jgi:hypothetical protein